VKRVLLGQFLRSVLVAGALSAAGAALLGGLVLAEEGGTGTVADGAVDVSTDYFQQRPVTGAGCCSAFGWSEDALRVRFLDSRAGVSGWWSVDTATADPRFETAQMGYESPSGRFLSLAEGTWGAVRVLDRDTGESTLLRNVGGEIRFSPDETRIVFSILQAGFGLPWNRSATTYVADADGSNQVALGATVGSVVAWLPDGESLLVRARRGQDDNRGLWLMDASNGMLTLLLSADHLRSVRLSPDGTRVAYVRALESNPNLAGLWVLDLETLATTRMSVSGSYAWHPSGDGLIVIPARTSSKEMHTLWWLDVRDGEAVALTDPESAPLRISNLNWALSPSGNAIAYRGAEFLGLWVLNFGLALDAVLMAAPPTVPDMSLGSQERTERR